MPRFDASRCGNPTPAAGVAAIPPVASTAGVAVRGTLTAAAAVRSHLTDLDRWPPDVSRCGLMRVGSFAVIAGLGLLPAACGDDVPPPPGRADAGRDAGIGDADVPDTADNDGQSGDGAVDSPDAEPLPTLCAVPRPGMAPTSVEPDIAIAGGPTDTVVVWRDRAADSGGDLYRLHSVTIRGDGTALEPQLVVESAQVLHDPVAVWRPDAWQVMWSEESETAGAFDLRARRLTADDGVPTGPPESITTNGAGGRHAAIPADGTFVAFIDEGVRVLSLDEFGAATGPAIALSEDADQQALAAVSRTDLEGMALPGSVAGVGGTSAWIRDSAAQSAIVELLGTEPPAGALALLWAGDRGGFFFDVLLGGTRRALRFRRLDSEMNPDGEIRAFAETSLASGGVSATNYRGGYAAIWRATAAIRRQLRLALVDLDGNNGFETQLLLLASEEGEQQLARTNEGELFAAWSDESTANWGGIDCQR